MWLVGSKPIRSTLQFQQHLFRVFFFFFTNDVMCRALWYLLSTLPYLFSIFEDVGVDSPTFLSFPRFWRSRERICMNSAFLGFFDLLIGISLRRRHSKPSRCVSRLQTQANWEQLSVGWQERFFNKISKNAKLTKLARTFISQPFSCLREVIPQFQSRLFHFPTKTWFMCYCTGFAEPYTVPCKRVEQVRS